MNIQKNIASKHKSIMQDKISRVRIAKGWRVKFKKLAPKMTQAEFCRKYDLSPSRISHYMFQTIKDVKEFKTGNAYPRIPSWDRVLEINAALQAESV